MQAKPHPDVQRLQTDLLALLANPNTTQTKIAKGAGVDQPFVSRVKNGRVLSVSAKGGKLQSYVSMHLAGVALPPPVLHAARAYFASGGSPEVLTQTIQLLTAARTQ